MRQFIAVTLVQYDETAVPPVPYRRPAIIPVDKILFIQELQSGDADGRLEAEAGAQTSIEMPDYFLYVIESMKYVYDMLVTK